MITLTKEDYEEQKKDKKSILSRLKFWMMMKEVKENSQTIKISKEDYEDQEKDQSLLSRLKFWDEILSQVSMILKWRLHQKKMK